MRYRRIKLARKVSHASSCSNPIRRSCVESYQQFSEKVLKLFDSGPHKMYLMSHL